MRRENKKNPQSIYDAVRDFREKCTIDDQWELKTDLTFQQTPFIMYTTRIKSDKGITVAKSNSIVTTDMATIFDVEAISIARALRYAGFLHELTREEIKYQDMCLNTSGTSESEETPDKEKREASLEKDPAEEYGLPPDLGLGIEIIDGRAYVTEQEKNTIYKNRHLLSECGFNLDRDMKPKRWFKELN